MTKEDMISAFISGYEAGHNDTVEGGFGYMEEKAHEWLEEFLYEREGE